MALVLMPFNWSSGLLRFDEKPVVGPDAGVNVIATGVLRTGVVVRASGVSFALGVVDRSEDLGNPLWLLSDDGGVLDRRFIARSVVG